MILRFFLFPGLPFVLRVSKEYRAFYLPFCACMTTEFANATQKGRKKVLHTFRSHFIIRHFDVWQPNLFLCFWFFSFIVTTPRNSGPSDSDIP